MLKVVAPWPVHVFTGVHRLVVMMPHRSSFACDSLPATAWPATAWPEQNGSNNSKKMTKKEKEEANRSLATGAAAAFFCDDFRQILNGSGNLRSLT
jgi:hypothetical protein